MHWSYSRGKVEYFNGASQKVKSSTPDLNYQGQDFDLQVMKNVILYL